MKEAIPKAHLRQLPVLQSQMPDAIPTFSARLSWTGGRLHWESTDGQTQCPGLLTHVGCQDLLCWRPRCMHKTKPIIETLHHAAFCKQVLLSYASEAGVIRPEWQLPCR